MNMSKFQLSDKTLSLILDSLPVGILLTNSDGDIVFSNYKLQNLLGYSEDELLGLSVHDLVPGHFKKSHKTKLANYNADPSPRSMGASRMLPAVKKNGEETQIKIGLTPLVIDNSSYVLASVIEAENQVLQVATHNDPLTGLPNRILFNDIGENLRNHAIRNKAGLGLMFIDLDNFKYTNDQHGHHIGDFILCKVADILSENIRKNDIVGRLGGDEFVLCLYGVESSTFLESLSTKLIKEISSIIDINGNVTDISASIGAIYTITPDNHPLKEMIKMADKLMYKAKKTGKGTGFAEEI